MALPNASPIDSVALPRRPGSQQRAPFPMLAVLAPLVGAAVLFAITRSPMMIAFAALSPVIAIASTVDGRVAARRRRRSERRAYDLARERFLGEVALAHTRERALVDDARPTAHALMSDPAHVARRWTAPRERFTPVRIGTGAAPSVLVVSGTSETDDDRELLRACRVLDGAPVAVDPSAGIGIVAPPVVGRAFARGLVVQLTDAHPPGVLAVTAPPGSAYDWLDDYPHSARVDDEPLRLRIVDDHPDASERAEAGHPAAGPDVGGPMRPGGSASSRPTDPHPIHPADGDLRGRESPFGRRTETAIVALADEVDRLPAGCSEVVRVDASGSVTMLTSPATSDTLRGELISARSAARFGDELASTARTRGVMGVDTLPEAVAFSELPTASRHETSRGLPAIVGVTADGPLVLDLVASGPHAIVTGTTGSGKSELLISWVLGMASRLSPELVNFLLVDFKGGTAFGRLTGLPHTVGVVTDLGHGEAGRALKSLRAELRRREAELATLGVADVRDSELAPARLVIVVDEAAAMLSAFPELAALFADVAARGRALGVHLILGTQRAAGVVADGLLANCGLRVSLRLASESDSAALLGTDAAARLPHAVPGRLIVAKDGVIVTAQAATADPADVASVAAAHGASTRAGAPWMPALPDRIPLTAFGAVPPGAVVLGAMDDPEHQAQEGIVYRPSAAHLLVLGVRGSGKSTALGTIAAQCRSAVLRVPADVEGAWDAFEYADTLLHGDPPLPLDAASRTEQASGRCLVIVDDLDALLTRFDDEHREEVLARMRSLLVDGPRAGIGVVCAAAALPSGLRSVSGHFGERLVLRQADRQEHVLAGAPPDLYDEAAPPGRGVWHGLLAQVALACVQPNARHVGGGPADAAAARPGTTGIRAADDHAKALTFAPGAATLIVSRAPGAVAKRLRSSAQALQVVELAGAVDAQFGASPLTMSSDIAISRNSDPIAVVGDVDAWQSRWQLLTRLRNDGPIVFDGCTLAQVRAILHSRVLPPATAQGHALAYDPDGSFRRVRMPA
ncbi:hypothetical protein GCM10027568_03190 [Humibacter soli]